MRLVGKIVFEQPTQRRVHLKQAAVKEHAKLIRER
jgi:hypothetical protein